MSRIDKPRIGGIIQTNVTHEGTAKVTENGGLRARTMVGSVGMK